MKRIYFFLFIAFVCGASCRVQKQTGRNYLETMRDTAIVATAAAPQPIIQKADLLAIKVYSLSVIAGTDVPYNLPEGAGSTAGFLVDEQGNIEYPRLGTIHAEGLTKAQLAATIRKALESQLKQPSVMVRFINYKITVLGQVGRPGSITVPTEQATILEAIGLAGDILESGKKTSVKILREANGQRQVGLIDLTSDAMFNSPYYYLQQNDVVIVEQSGRVRTQQERQNLAQQIGLVTSIITTIALILNFIK